MIPLSAENRDGAGVAAGDPVNVTIELDDAPREVEVPADLAKALKAAPGARKTFDALSYSAPQGMGALDQRRQDARDAAAPHRQGRRRHAPRRLTAP